LKGREGGHKGEAPKTRNMEPVGYRKREAKPNKVRKKKKMTFRFSRKGGRYKPGKKKLGRRVDAPKQKKGKKKFFMMNIGGQT